MHGCSRSHSLLIGPSCHHVTMFGSFGFTFLLCLLAPPTLISKAALFNLPRSKFSQSAPAPHIERVAECRGNSVAGWRGGRVSYREQCVRDQKTRPDWAEEGRNGVLRRWRCVGAGGGRKGWGDVMKRELRRYGRRQQSGEEARS